jgi:hypothetical protein
MPGVDQLSSDLNWDSFEFTEVGFDASHSAGGKLLRRVAMAAEGPGGDGDVCTESIEAPGDVRANEAEAAEHEDAPRLSGRLRRRLGRRPVAQPLAGDKQDDQDGPRQQTQDQLRAGVGVYTVPFIIAGNFQPGFSQTTAIVPSNDLGFTFNATLANPFPSGVLPPAGASRGADTFLGQDLNNASGARFVPVDFRNAQNTRYTVSVQRELPNQWLLEGGYTGSHGWNLTTGGGNQAGEIELNGIPAQYLSTNRSRDQGTIDFLGALVPNPFRGLLPSTAFNAATIARSQLLRPYPQFGNVRTFDDDGTSQYNSAQFKIEKRFTRGYTLLAAYTWSRFTERVFKLNPTDAAYEERVSAADVPHRVTLSGVWELPFGRDRRWASGAHGLADALVGGWSVQAIGQIQSGQPIDLNARNVYFNGDLSRLETDYAGDTNNPVFDVSGFYFHDAAVQTNGVDDPVKQRADTRIRLANNLRYFPSKLDGLRSPSLNLWDISVIKQVRVTDRVRAQFHAEFLNAFNHAVYANPNTDPTNSDFGKVTSQTNLPRDIQLALKLTF